MVLIRSILEALELDSKQEKAVIPDSSFSELALMFPYRGGVTSLFVFFSRNTVSSDIHGVYMVTMMTVELVVTMCFIICRTHYYVPNTETSSTTFGTQKIHSYQNMNSLIN